MKRRRGEGTLTGGTGDVSPQWMTFAATQSAADTTTTTTQTIPVQRLPHGEMAQVMEVLKVYIERPQVVAIASATEASDNYNIFLSTTSFGTTATTFREPRVFAADMHVILGAFTAAGTYGLDSVRTVLYDLTDGAGHGVLIATDNIFAQVVTSGTSAANTYGIKLLYRWKNVSLQEYIGIVQSQQ